MVTDYPSGLIPVIVTSPFARCISTAISIAD